MNYNLRLCSLLLFFLFNGSYGCPFIITNDSGHRAIIVDPYNKQAINMAIGETREIDPSITGWPYYFYREKLDIYVPRQDNPNLFYRHYQLQEKYCTKDKTELSLSKIAKLTAKPTERFEVFTFKPHEHTAHTH